MAVLTLPGVKRFWKNVKEYIDSRILASQNTFPTKVSDLQNDAGYYNQSTLPAINNGILTIQKNGQNVSTFSANQSSNATANIQVPTKVSELQNDSGYLTEHQDLSDFATKQDISNLIDSAPTTLDTLKELADAIGNNPDFASTLATQIASKADDDAVVHKHGSETIPGEKKFVLPIIGSVTGNAGTADEFKSEKYIVLSGDVTGSGYSKANWTVQTSLAPSGVSEGVYGQLTDVLDTKSLDIKIPEITVDSKGRITNIENHVVNCEIPDTTYSAGTGLSLNGTQFNVTSIAGNSNLQWNAEVTLGTVGGFAIKAKLPANPITEGDVIIDGYVTGSGSFDKDGNCHITVTPNISDTPSVWYVGKTNAADKWGDDENGNPWGSTQNHPFATLGYAITQTNIHTFPGNTIQIKVLDGGSYIDSDYRGVVVNCNTYVESAASSRPSFRCSWEISFNSVSSLSLDGIDLRCSIAPSAPINGQTFFRCYGSGRLAFVHGCRMIIDNNNFGTNVWGFIILYDNVELGLDVRDSQPALYLELANAGTTIYSYCICFSDRSTFSAMAKDSSDPNLVINAPAGTKIVGEAIRVDRSNSVAQYDAANVHDGIRERFLIDWNIADDSELRQVYLHKYAYLGLRKNPAKGRALPGSSVGTIADGADYDQLDA